MQVKFDNPRCAAARRLVELHGRRAELRHQSRVADLAETNAERELERRRSELKTAEARALAFGQQTDNLPPLRGNVTRAEKASGEATATAERLRHALLALDAEMVTIARDSARELLDEVIEDHDALRARADDALAQLSAAADGMRVMFGDAMRLTTSIDPRLNQNLREPDTPEQIVARGAAPSLFIDDPFDAQTLRTGGGR